MLGLGYSTVVLYAHTVLQNNGTPSVKYEGADEAFRWLKQENK